MKGFSLNCVELQEYQPKIGQLQLKLQLNLMLKRMILFHQVMYFQLFQKMEEF